jgi:hypothetical protein
VVLGWQFDASYVVIHFIQVAMILYQRWKSRRWGDKEDKGDVERGRVGERESGRVTPSPLHPLTPSLQTTNHQLTTNN